MLDIISVTLELSVLTQPALKCYTMFVEYRQQATKTTNPDPFWFEEGTTYRFKYLRVFKVFCW